MEQQTLFKVRDKRNKGWFWVENEYFNGFGKILGAPAIAVYVSLCRHADNDQKAYPSQKTIADETKLSERKVRDVIKQLEKYRIIEISKERNHQGKWLNNVYWLTDKSEWVYPEAGRAYGKPEANNDIARGKNQRHVVPTNNTKGTILIKNNTHIRLDKPTRRKEISFKKSDYDLVLQEYQALKGIKLNGKEFDPVMQDIKTMFMSQRKPEEIIKFMKWMAEKSKDEDKKWDWTRNWTIKTIRLKLPEFLAGKLERSADEDIIIPEYAKQWHFKKQEK